MFRQPSILIIALLLCLLSSCYKDEITDSEKTINVAPPHKIYINKVTGTVYDINKHPVRNVRISIGGQETLTDDNGVFELKKVKFSENVTGVYLSANKNGYYDTGVRLYPNTNHDITTSITLVPKGEVHSHNNSEGVTINHSSGMQISAAPNAFIKNGKPYNGNVYINIYWVNPNDLAKYQHKVQVYEAASTDASSTVKPQFISMAYISVTDAGGVPLDVQPTTPLSVTFPTDEGSSASVPELQLEKATLLSLDKEQGLWIEEGSAQKSAGGYDAQLKHFNWWSIAQMSESTELCITFENENAPQGHFYTISTPSGKMLYVGNLHYGAKSCIPVPRETDLLITVRNECYVSISNYEVQGLTAPTTSVTYEPQNAHQRTIKGEIVGCTDPETQDSVIIYYGTENSMERLGVYTDRFEIKVGQCYSGDRVHITAQAQNGKIIGTTVVKIATTDTEISATINTCKVLTNESSVTIGDKIYADAKARKNKEETLIIAGPENNPVIIGFDGFATGSFLARIIAGDICEGTVEITKYEQIGGTIEGTFKVSKGLSCKEKSGSFNAVREK